MKVTQGRQSVLYEIGSREKSVLYEHISKNLII